VILPGTRSEALADKRCHVGNNSYGRGCGGDEGHRVLQPCEISREAVRRPVQFFPPRFEFGIQHLQLCVFEILDSQKRIRHRMRALLPLIKSKLRNFFRRYGLEPLDCLQKNVDALLQVRQALVEALGGCGRCGAPP
jgi:hypothetical protein